MYILAIHTGHNATVGLLHDGKVIACTSEERFNRKKNFVGWPEQSLAWVLKFAGITVADVDLVTIPSRDARSHRINLFNAQAFYDSNKLVVEKTLSGKITDTLLRRFYKNPQLWHHYEKLVEKKYNSTEKKKAEESIRNEYAKRLGISQEKILFVDHHYAHATSVAFNLPRDKNTLVFTLDGEGDGLCATVSVFDGMTMRRIAATSKNHSLGALYMECTRYLGMKPNEHEFKVMGLAPYAKEEHVEKVFQKLSKVIFLDSKNRLCFQSVFSTQFAKFYFQDEFHNMRFDNIAGGIQKLTEELILSWIKEGIKQTGIRDIALSGGVFMNVKASMRVAELPEVSSIFVMPSAADESLVFGTMWHGYRLVTQQKNMQFTPEPIKDLYLGKSWTDEEIGEYLKREEVDKRYKVKLVKNIEEVIASLLAKGEVVARFNGRAEWGARALGNRSILANPSNFDTIKVINEMIKNRDFWMPFTPSMLNTEEKRYFVNPKSIFAPYMCITFHSTPLAQQHLPAAMHPYDKTIRPQLVIESWNPSYYKMIKTFKHYTGIGAVLNTSFNLHGEPNVNSPQDAIHTMDNSGLRNLAIGNWIVQKK